MNIRLWESTMSGLAMKSIISCRKFVGHKIRKKNNVLMRSNVYCQKLCKPDMLMGQCSGMLVLHWPAEIVVHLWFEMCFTHASKSPFSYNFLCLEVFNHLISKGPFGLKVILFFTVTNSLSVDFIVEFSEGNLISLSPSSWGTWHCGSQEQTTLYF